MNYIILDLEWNQGNEQKEKQLKELPFEIIEIGAVKLNSRMEICDSFHELIRPQVYKEMHYMTKKLLHLDMEELQSGRSFLQVIKSFLAWCGEDYMFGTWGPQDLTELQRNMKFYGMEPLDKKPMKFYDVQKLFSIAFEDKKSRRNLEYAVDFLAISKDIPFHRALSDAYYTGRVLAKIKDPQVLQMISFDGFIVPHNKKEEVHIVFDDYAKYISRDFADKQELLADKEVSSTKCYLCHRNLKKKIRWFTPNGKHYYSVSYCEKHGFMKGKIRVRKTEDDRVYAVKTMKFITEEDAADIFNKKERARELRRLRKHKES